MKNGPQFEDYDWRAGSASAYGDTPRGVVMVEYDDNLLFDDEVVGQAISWSNYAAPTPFDNVVPLRGRSRRK